MSTLILGIDPGLTGGYGALCKGEFVECGDLPIVRDKSLGWVDAGEFLGKLIELRAGGELHAIVERVSAMPGQGVSSTFLFGSIVGSILATLQTANARIEFVTPAMWKKRSVSAARNLPHSIARGCFSRQRRLIAKKITGVRRRCCSRTGQRFAIAPRRLHEHRRRTRP